MSYELISTKGGVGQHEPVLVIWSRNTKYRVTLLLQPSTQSHLTLPLPHQLMTQTTTFPLNPNLQPCLIPALKYLTYPILQTYNQTSSMQPSTPIFSLTLGHGSVPPMPFNSLASSPDHPHPQNPNPNPHANNPHNPNLVDNPSSILQPSQTT